MNDPSVDKGGVAYFAKTDFRNGDRLFGIKRKDRRQHMYVIGKSGTGKTALLHNMVVQDIVNGEGVCVVDPHGEFVEGIVSMIPKERLKDVVYFNPADSDFNLGFNVLELPDPKYKHLVASGLMAIFTKIWANVWSARMEYIMNNAILALLDTPGSTLLGITRILVDKDFRQRIVSNLKDPVVKAFWVNEYEAWRDQFRNEAIAPIQNKVGQFLSTSMIRNVVGQSKSTIDIFDIMNTGKIFLVNVSKGRIGEDNSSLLGAMLITKIQLSAMERVRIPEEERKDYYLYVDEFQNFATDSFAGILSEARKYRLNLILAHQYVGQLVTGGSGSNVVSTKVRDAVFGNVGTMLVFRVGAADAEFLENEFSPELTIEDIVNLPNYSIYLKLLVDGIASRPFSAHTITPFKISKNSATENEVIEMSRKMYARPVKVVETEINRWSGMMGDDVSPEEHAAFGERPVIHERSSPAFDKKLAQTKGKFPAVCDSCGKNTFVHFKPTPGKPLYCDDCFSKMKAEGKIISPARSMQQTAAQTDVSELASMGIEFEAQPKPREPERHAPAPSRPPLPRPSPPRENPQKVFSKDEPVTKPARAPISLSELKAPPQEKKEREKKAGVGPDIEGLRNALKKTLEQRE
jgi:CxxC-x17-CxxC domain-containing protein